MDNDELDVILSSDDVTTATVYTPSHDVIVKKALVAVIPELLMSPDWSQGGTSIKRNNEGVKTYYSLLCGELGLPDLLNPSSYEVTDRSDIW